MSCLEPIVAESNKMLGGHDLPQIQYFAFFLPEYAPSARRESQAWRGVLDKLAMVEGLLSSWRMYARTPNWSAGLQDLERTILELRAESARG